MSIAAIGNSGLNIQMSASIQTPSAIGGAQAAGGNDAFAAIGATANGGLPAAGTPGNSSVNSMNALATALLLGAIAGSQDEESKKSDSLAGAALALLAYQSVMGMGSGTSAGAAGGAMMSGAVSAVGSFAAMG